MFEDHKMDKIEITRLVLEIKEKIYKFSNTFDSYNAGSSYHTFSDQEEEDKFNNDYKMKLQFTSNEIYNLFIILFDFTHTNNMRDQFFKKIGDRYYNNEELIKGTYYELVEEVFSDLAGDYEDFLKPYEVLFPIKKEVDVKDIKFEVKTLERLLEETNLLCKLNSKIPKSEPQVYNTVKQYIYILFPKSNNVAGQAFPTIAKVYKPDIFVPECNAVIEYKYIDKEDKINSTIAGIADDVKGYEENTDYHLFYAVFYFKTAYVPKERFIEIWTEKKFPKNWKPIYVIETN